MKESLKPIIYTLSQVEVKGRVNLSLLLNAQIALDREDISEAIKALEMLSVSGRNNADMVLGCIMALEELQKAPEEAAEEKEDAE